MPAYVPDRPPMTELANHRVNRPVSHRHGRAWQDALHFLLGYNLPPIISCHQPRPDASPRDYFFAYKRTPGARALAVFVELYEPGTAGDECSVVLDLSGGGGTYLPPAPAG